MEIKFIKFIVGFLSLPMLAALIFAHCIANAQVAKNSFIQDIFSGMASARKASETDKAAVMKFIKDFKKTFENLPDGESINSVYINKIIEGLDKIDVSKCPPEIKEKFDAFARDVRNQLGELEKFFNREYFSGKIDLGEKFEDYVKSKPEVAAKIDNISKSLQKSAQEFMASLVPYIAR